MTADELKEWALGQYAKYIRLTHAGAEAMGIPSLFLLQPSPAFQKPLTPQEIPFANGTRRELYLQMTEYLGRLRSNEGVPVISLLDVFQDTTEQVYIDPIHLNELGKRQLSSRIADLIESEWGWPRRRSGARQQ
jgi:lysophospholipase L1-like esterase